MADPRPARSPVPPALALLSALCTASGAVALVYEVVWLKRFAQVFGSSALALGSVVAAFLGGLGLGSRWLAPLADRARRPLRSYAQAELAIALLALCVPAAIGALSRVSASAYPHISSAPAALFLARLGTCFLCLGPPTCLMGVTLPLLVKHLCLTGHELGESTARMCALNCLGAAAGAALAGFALLPVLGLRLSGRAAAAANLGVALIAWRASRRAPAGGEARARPAAARAAAAGASACGEYGGAPLRARGAAFLSGGAALVLQMVFARELSLLAGGSTYAYAAGLATFLAGVAAGGFAFQRLAPSAAALPRSVALAALLACAATLLGLGASPGLARWVGTLVEERGNALVNALVCLAASAALELVPALCTGFLFPAVVQSTRAGARDAARAVGDTQAFNTAGAVLASLLAAPVLLPLLGSLGAVSAALAALALVPAVLFARRRHALLPLAASLSAAALLLGLLPLARRDPLSTNLGLYLYGSAKYPPGEPRAEKLYFREGRTSNVLVAREAHPGSPSTVTLRIDGKIDGSDAADMPMQLASAYLPLALRPDAREVLIIGFGTGTTAGACLLFDGVGVDCCEIEPAILSASSCFHHVNHRPEETPRFRPILDDGRNYVLGTEARYDLVISEPSNPWIAGTANLFTLEFFRAARARLDRGGLLAQWLQSYALSRDEYALVLNTVRSVFEHAALARIGSGDTLLLASEEPIVPERAAIDRAEARFAASEEVLSDLRSVFELEGVRAFLLAHLAADDAGLARMVERAGVRGLHTDDNLRLEFDSPRYLFRQGSIERGIEFEIDLSLYQRLIEGWGFTHSQLDALDRWRSTYAELGVPEAAELFAQLGARCAAGERR